MDAAIFLVGINDLNSALTGEDAELQVDLAPYWLSSKLIGLVRTAWIHYRLGAVYLVSEGFPIGGIGRHRVSVHQFVR